MKKKSLVNGRVIALYSDALSVIANHPGGDEVSEWMKAKAQEALEKTTAAAEGRIYAQIPDAGEQLIALAARKEERRKIVALLARTIEEME